MVNGLVGFETFVDTFEHMWIDFKYVCRGMAIFAMRLGTVEDTHWLSDIFWGYICDQDFSFGELRVSYRMSTHTHTR